MFTTCIYCHKPLGQNEAIEEFPVGRRLAFDSAVGRLWVVCRNCERWNLSPIETRWEAIAKIADKLLVPDEVERQLEALKGAPPAQ